MYSIVKNVRCLLYTSISAVSQKAPLVRRNRVSSIIHEHIDASMISHMDLSGLEYHCAIESERFYRGQPHDTRFAYELFRRALVNRCERAWEILFNQYRVLVESWVRRSGAFASSGETSEFFVISAFTRFWQAVNPERFGSFTSLAALLHYLQLCASCVAVSYTHLDVYKRQAAP